MTDFLVKHNIVSRLGVLWAMGIVTWVVKILAENATTMSPPAATVAVSVVGLFGLAALNWRKSRGLPE